MTYSPWTRWALVSCLLTTLGLFAVGIWLPGRPSPLDPSGGSTPSLVSEAKKKKDLLGQARGQFGAHRADGWGLTGSEGEHRVFVSPTLIYLPDNPEPVQALDWKMRTSDGLEIGWKMKYGFDPADPSLGQQDPDGDGFTNAEEHEAQTDPLQREDSPPKERKLRVKSAEPVLLSVTCPEKSGGFFTIRFQAGKRREEFRGRPGESFWLLASPDLLKVFLNEKEWNDARDKARASGQGGHGIPLKFSSYREKIQRVKDASTGGVEIEVDNSEIDLERGDALSGTYPLRFSGAMRAKPLTWDVGNILFVAAGVEEEIGPFRIGEIFSYGGKEFAVMGREEGKIQLRDTQDRQSAPFWVPPLTPPSSPVP